MEHKEKKESKSDKIMKKVSAFTQHGKEMQEARAKAGRFMSQEVQKANMKSPGMAFIKGTHVQPFMEEMMARRQAYKSKGAGNSLKTVVPFVGMGKKGKEALDELTSK